MLVTVSDVELWGWVPIRLVVVQSGVWGRGRDEAEISEEKRLFTE